MMNNVVVSGDINGDGIADSFISPPAGANSQLLFAPLAPNWSFEADVQDIIIGAPSAGNTPAGAGGTYLVFNPDAPVSSIEGRLVPSEDKGDEFEGMPVLEFDEESVPSDPVNPPQVANLAQHSSSSFWAPPSAAANAALVALSHSVKTLSAAIALYGLPITARDTSGLTTNPAFVINVEAPPASRNNEAKEDLQNSEQAMQTFTR